MIEAAVNAGIPPWLLRAAPTCYALPRHLRDAGCVAPGVVPTTGVVAGDATAMHVVSAIMAEVLAGCALDVAVNVAPLAYVDDVQAMILAPRNVAVGLAVRVGPPCARQSPTSASR